VRDRLVHVQHRSVMSDTAIGFLLVAFLVLAVLWVIAPVLFSGPSHKAPPSLAAGGSTTTTVPPPHTARPTAKVPSTRAADTTLPTATAKTKTGVTPLPRDALAQSDNTAQPVIGSAMPKPTSPASTTAGETAMPSGTGATAGPTGTAAPANPISTGGATNPTASEGTTVPTATHTMTLLTCSSTGRH
jgi:hypothetical protein